MMVHLLVQGQAVCGMEGKPASWPKDHWWADLPNKDRVNCPGCLGRAGSAEPEVHSSEVRLESGFLLVGDLSAFFTAEEWAAIQKDSWSWNDIPRAALAALSKKCGVDVKATVLKAGFRIPKGVFPVYRGTVPVSYEEGGIMLQTKAVQVNA